MRIILLTVLLGIPCASMAMKPYGCRNGAFAGYTDLKLGQIVAGKDGAVHARDDSEGCPELAKCVKKDALQNGDEVLTAHAAEGWVCIYSAGKETDYTGWIPAENVRAIPALANPPPDTWTGSWTSVGGTGSVAIHAGSGGTMKVRGSARWYGGKAASGEEIVHFGEINGEASPTANELIVKDGDDQFACVARFQLIGPYLVGTDNNHCGGLNVRFDGVYRRGQPG